MIRTFISVAVISALLVSCGQSGTAVKDSAKTELSAADKIEFDSLVANPDKYVGKNVVVEGKVVHVCTHSGKKLFIVGSNPDITLFIAAGENISKFPMELLGSEVSVEGTISRTGNADEAPVENHTSGAEGVAEGAKPKEMCETETKLAAQPSLADIVMEYKSHTVK
jgi:hypothetical protein